MPGTSGGRGGIQIHQTAGPLGELRHDRATDADGRGLCDSDIFAGADGLGMTGDEPQRRRGVVLQERVEQMQNAVTAAGGGSFEREDIQLRRGGGVQIPQVDDAGEGLAIGLVDGVEHAPPIGGRGDGDFEAVHAGALEFFRRRRSGADSHPVCAMVAANCSATPERSASRTQVPVSGFLFFGLVAESADGSIHLDS